jgi:hypothetical protein
VKTTKRILKADLLKALEALFSATGEALIEEAIYPTSALKKAHAQALAILLKARHKRRSQPNE